MRYSEYLEERFKPKYHGVTLKFITRVTARQLASYLMRDDSIMSYHNNYNKSMGGWAWRSKEFFGFELTEKYPSLYLLMVRFCSKLFKKHFDFNNYEQSINNIKSFLYDLYVNDNTDVCDSINECLLKNNFNKIKFIERKELIDKLYDFEKRLKKDVELIEDQVYIEGRLLDCVEMLYKKLGENTPPTSTGVYFLFSNNMELEYVGMSTNLSIRILSSLKEKGVKNFAYLQANSKQDAIELETFFITKYKPHYNTSCKKMKCFEPSIEIPKITDVHCLNTEDLIVDSRGKIEFPEDYTPLKYKPINLD